MKFEVYTDQAGEYRWRLKAKNGPILADSGEGYKEVGDLVRAVNMIRAGAPTAKIEHDHERAADEQPTSQQGEGLV